MKVPFSIKVRYRDGIVCDVLPMCTSYLLLGWSWLFDCKLLHDGYQNSYAFQKDGKKILLNPMPLAKVRATQT